MSTELDDLTRVFQQLGADRPEGWARSQAEEGIPQLHRFLFLRQAWRQVIGEDSDHWIDNYIAAYRHRLDEPYAGAGRALERLLTLGADRADIVDLVRAMQAELLFGFCYLLEDPQLHDEDEERVSTLGWALVATDADGEPTSEVIGGLHESVLEMDPTGREMTPRPGGPAQASDPSP